MITGYEGTQAYVEQRRCRGHRAAGRRSAAPRSARRPAQAWAAGRFHGPYLRDSMLDVGVLVETLETATYWSRLHAAEAGGRATR